MAKNGWGDPSFWEDSKQVESDFFKFTNVGDTLIGKLVEKGESEVRGSLVGRYTFVREDDSNVACHGTVQLDDMMAFVAPGSIVRIEYIGNEKTQNGQMKVFDVKERLTADSA